jgi:hypothetical protein
MASTTNDAFSSKDGQLRIGSDQHRISHETAAHRAEAGSVMPGESGPPPQVPIPRGAGVEPSIPPVAGPTGTGFRISPAWGSLAVALFMLGTVALLAARAARKARAAAAQTAQVTPPALTAERRAPTPVAPVASASSEPPAEEHANHAAPVDVPKSKPLDIKALPQDPSALPGLYLRVGLGPSCPEMLTYGRQFLLSGMADSKVVQLKSGACALVRGPYPADIVQQRRKEHNDRRIRGFDTAVVVDGSDFDKWLLGM